VDDQPIAESLPERYRELLDRVAEVSKAGFRAEADLIRAAAIRAYSRRWNNATDRRLQELIGRGDRVLEGRDRARRRVRRQGVLGVLDRAAFALRLRLTPRRAPRRTVTSASSHTPAETRTA
jgi:hypothetical protein